MGRPESCVSPLTVLEAGDEPPPAPPYKNFAARRSWVLTFALPREAEGAREVETAAAVQLQARWRGYLLRARLAGLAAAATQIEALWRGHAGRKVAAVRKLARDRDERLHYFGRAAGEVQRWWGGYWCRTRVHSFSARKQYIQNVLAVNARLLREMDSNHEEQMEREEGQSLQVARQRFEDTVKNLHHLTSTESCRGIFNSAFETVYGVPTVGGHPIEGHLRAVAKGGSLLEPGQGIPEADLQAIWIQSEGPGTPSGSSRDGADWQVGMEFNSVETPFISAVHDREVAMRQSIRASEP